MIPYISKPLDRLSIQEAAEYLGVKPSTLAKWRMYDEGPDFIKIPGSRKIFYTVGALNDFIYGPENGKGGR